MTFETPIIVHADVTDGLLKLEDNSVQLVVTSPPYNLGKVYERDTPMSLDEYIRWLTPVIKLLCRKIKPAGSICWQVGNFISKRELFPLDYFFYDIFSKEGLKLRNRIIWRFSFGRNASQRFSGRYETLLWFTKTDGYTFNLDPVRVPQLYPGKKHSAQKGPGRAGQPSGNPLGKNPSDFWTFSAEECFLNNPIWELPNVKASHPEQTIHPCQFPHELAERCILALSNKDDLILDPFLGAGTTAIAALKAGRRAYGIDRNAEYINLALQRIEAFQAGTLTLRQSGKPVRVPSTGEAVARVPAAWLEAAQ